MASGRSGKSSKGNLPLGLKGLTGVHQAEKVHGRAGEAWAKAVSSSTAWLLGETRGPSGGREGLAGVRLQKEVGPGTQCHENQNLVLWATGSHGRALKWGWT